MKPTTIYKEAVKIWHEIAMEDDLKRVKLDLEVHKKILKIFHPGDYYYFIFNLQEANNELMSKEVQTVLGYAPEEVTVPFFLSIIHPDDHPWFLNFENYVVDFFGRIKVGQIPNYKVRYDFRVKKSDGEYIRLLHQMVIIQHNEDGNILRTLGVHTDVSHLKKEGRPVLSLIGLNGEPSFIDINVKEVFLTPSQIISEREREVLSLIIEGKETVEIAEELYISRHTVDSHRKNLLKKSNARNMAEMTAIAIRNGWV